jgi:transcriptional regulator with XRE-family HTH domain
MDKISERLRLVRDRLGYSQDGIASSIDMKQRTWADWEKQPPSALVHLKALAEKYGYSAQYLLGITDDPRPPTAETLSEDAQDLLALVKQLPASRQRDILLIAEAFFEEANPERPGQSPLDQASDKATGKAKDEPHVIE